MRLRHLTDEDIPDLMALTAAAGWNQTRKDWRLFLSYDPNGCFGIELDARIVASSTAMCYGTTLSWIGMVLTLPDFRGRGFARALTKTAIDYAGDRVIKLDASDLGRPLYQSMGFIAECPIERWVRPPGDAPETPEVGPVCYDPREDAKVFGADRSKLLRAFEEDEAASLPGAYAFGREGSNAPFFGPCVSETSEGADGLLRWFVSRHASRPVFMDLFPHHEQSCANASRLGFEPARRLTRMVLKPAVPAMPHPQIYATASFSWG